MSLKSKIEAVIYASEEPVTLQQLAGLLGDEVQAELDHLRAAQAELPMDGPDEAGFGAARQTLEAGTHDGGADAAVVSGASGEPSTVDAGGEDGSAEGASDGLQETVDNGDAANEGASPADEAGVAKREARDREKAIRQHLRHVCDGLIREYAESDRGIEVREVASGYRMSTKPEYHDAVRGFVKTLNPPLRLTLQALETLAVVAYKQPVTAAEISEIRGVDSSGVLGGLMTRKLIATAGRKQVIGRPMLYKTTRDFLLRFGLKDVNELPSMEEFERMAGELAEQEDLPMDSTDTIVERANARGDAERIREETAAGSEEDSAESGNDESASQEDTEQNIDA